MDKFKIIFNDEAIVVVNKISSLLIQPSPKEKITLTLLLQEKLKEKVYPCHRLDRETQGLVIYAKYKLSQKYIMEAFRKRKIEKKYIALVRGKFPKNRGIFIDKIIDKMGRKFGEKPKLAKTVYKVIKKNNFFSKVELTPITGRTHQLRLQLAKRGFPILGDYLYGRRKDFPPPVRLKKLALCAYYLKFPHPLTQEKITLTVPLPDYMQELA